MKARLVAKRTVYGALGWTATALLLGLVACAPVPPAPPAPPSATAISAAPTADARALVMTARQDARERIWAAITVSPEVIPGGPTFVGAPTDASRVLSGIGCRFTVRNDDTVERRFTGLRLAVRITTRLAGSPVTNDVYLTTHGFAVPAGGSTLVGPADLASNGPGSFEYQVGGGWEGESWGRVYHGPLASQDAFIAADVPDVSLTVLDPTFGQSDKGFPVTGCQQSA